MDSLFGEGTSLPLRFFIAFVVVFALIAAAAWLIRRFGSGSLSAGVRGRAPRLAVIEAGAVDGRRKLVLIRRDNVEHLLMIGGPTDIVVEANIIRGQSSRDTRAAPAAETRTLSLGEESGWPLQPEPAPRPARAATRPAPLEDAATWSLQPELAPPAAPAAPAAAPKRSRASDALAGLAAELNVTPAEPAASRTPVLETPRPAPKPATPAAPAPAAAATDNNLADMASRLEAALKRPAPAPAPRPAAPAAAAPAKAVTPPPAPAKAPPVATPAKPATPPAAKTPDAPAAAAPAAEKASNAFSSIEEEMANLLGRPGKSS